MHGFLHSLFCFSISIAHQDCLAVSIQLIVLSRVSLRLLSKRDLSGKVACLIPCRSDILCMFMIFAILNTNIMMWTRYFPLIYDEL